MTLRIPALLEGLLDATTRQGAAKAEVDRLRTVLEDEGARRLADEGAAPTWNTPGLGRVAYAGIGEPKATVHDDQALAAHLAQEYPTEVTATITIPAEHLEHALEVLEFGEVQHLGTRLDVRPAFLDTYLADATLAKVDEGDGKHSWRAVDGEGVGVPGIIGVRTPARLTVTLDRERKAKAAEEAHLYADKVVAEATVLEDEESETVVASPDYLDALNKVDLNGLRVIARARHLTVSGTRDQLVMRIALASARATDETDVEDGALLDRPHRYVPHGGTDSAYDRSCVVCGRYDDDPGNAHVSTGESAMLADAEDRQAQDEATAPHRTSAEALDAHRAEAPHGGPNTMTLGEAQAIAALPDDDADAVEEVVGARDDAVRSMEAAGSREELRALARRLGVAPGGTKRDVSLALVLAGARANQVKGA